MSLKDEIKAILSDEDKVFALMKLFEEHKSGNKSTKEPELKEGQWCFMWDVDCKRHVRIYEKFKEARHYDSYNISWENASIIDEPILTWFDYEGFKPEWIDDKDVLIAQTIKGIDLFIKGIQLINAIMHCDSIKQFALFRRAKK